MYLHISFSFMCRYTSRKADPLQNRTMHIRNVLSKQYIENEKQYIRAGKQYIDKLMAAGLSKRSAENAAKLYDEFGLECFFGRSDIIPLLNITITPASSLLKKLAAAGITEAVSGMGKGKYRFSPVFFRS